MSLNGNILDYTLKSVNEYTMQSAHLLVDLLIRDGIATKKEKRKKKLNYI